MFIKKANILMKLLSSLMLISVFLFSTAAFAQQLPGQLPSQSQSSEYTDDELIAFVNAAQKITPLQQESQLKMIEKIEEENLTVEQFNKIIESHNTGEINATDEELESFNNAVEYIQEIQMEYQEVITETIAEEGIAPAKYEQIMAGYQQDPQLQMRINEILEQSQGDQ